MQRASVSIAFITFPILRPMGSIIRLQVWTCQAFPTIHWSMGSHGSRPAIQRSREPLFTPTTVTSQDIQINDTLSWVHGKHMFKAGPQIHWDQFNLLQIGQPRGNMSFSGQFHCRRSRRTAKQWHGVADMLLGLPVSSKISTVSYFGTANTVMGLSRRHL